MFVAADLKGLVAMEHIEAKEPIIEFMGNFWLLEEYQKSIKENPQSHSTDYALRYRFYFYKII